MAATGVPAAHSISPFCIHSAVLITKLHTGFSIPSGRSNQSSPVLMMTNEESITIGLISSAISGMLPKLYATSGSVPICAAAPSMTQLRMPFGILPRRLR